MKPYSTRYNVFRNIINLSSFGIGSPTEIREYFGHLNVSPKGALTWKLNDKILDLCHDDIKAAHKIIRDLIKSIPFGSKYVSTCDTDSGFGVERKD